MSSACLSDVPLQVWMTVFDFVKPHEEFPLATVCSDWNVFLTKRRERRSQKKWETWIGVVVNTVPRLQWALSAGLKKHKPICRVAASHGMLEVLKWARLQGVLWNSDTCGCAAFYGHLNVLQWALAEGCDWCTSACQMAVCGGHLDVLEWLRDNVYPFEHRTLFANAVAAYRPFMDP